MSTGRIAKRVRLQLTNMPVQSQPGPVPPTNDQLERTAKILESIFEKATTYTKVILGLGYAALFAVWSGTKSDLSQHQRVLSALLALSSLMFYIIFEIFQMIINSRLHWSFVSSMQRHPGNLGAALQEYEQAAMRWKGRLLKSWIWILVLTIPTGVGAACVLVWAFVVRLR